MSLCVQALQLAHFQSLAVFSLPLVGRNTASKGSAENSLIICPGPAEVRDLVPLRSQRCDTNVHRLDGGQLGLLYKAPPVAMTMNLDGFADGRLNAYCGKTRGVSTSKILWGAK